MRGEIGREHEGGDQGEIRLRRPVEQHPADNGRARWIGLWHVCNACLRCSRDCHVVIPLFARLLCLSHRKPYSIRDSDAMMAANLSEQLMISFMAGRRRLFALLTLIVACCGWDDAQDQRRGLLTPSAAGTIHPVVAKHGMVVAQEKIAARIGADVLARGGNAVDAAVATGFAMAVTYPRAGNIGGGGFMIIHSAERHEDIAIDYRETAPAATTREIYLGADGKPDMAE